MKYFILFLKKLLIFTLKPLSFVPALLVMYMIFQFSSQDGMSSAELSYKVSNLVVREIDTVLDKEWTEEQIEYRTERIHFYVRKMAHITEYFVLAVTLALPLYVYGLRGIWLIILAGTICVGFAAMDEFHQSFVAGRGSTKKDVLIDSIGIFSGILLTQFCGFIGRKTIFSPLCIKRHSYR